MTNASDPKPRGWQMLLGALPFLAYGALSLAFHFWAPSGALSGVPWLRLVPYLSVYALALGGLLAGGLAGFPRWAYAYLFWALILTWWLSDMRIAGIYRFDGRMWLPFAGVLLLPLLLRRSLDPLRRLLSGLRQDWTLVTFGLYTFWAFAAILFDENHHPYLALFIIATALLTATGTWLYLRLPDARGRLLALIGGWAAMVLLGVLNDLTWDWRAYYNRPADAQNFSLIGLGFWLLVVFGASLLSYLVRQRSNQLKTSA